MEAVFVLFYRVHPVIPKNTRAASELERGNEVIIISFDGTLRFEIMGTVLLRRRE
jgi:3-dehydroquinate synthase class II